MHPLWASKVRLRSWGVGPAHSPLCVPGAAGEQPDPDSEELRAGSSPAVRLPGARRRPAGKSSSSTCTVGSWPGWCWREILRSSEGGGCHVKREMWLCALAVMCKGGARSTIMSNSYSPSSSAKAPSLPVLMLLSPWEILPIKPRWEMLTAKVGREETARTVPATHHGDPPLRPQQTVSQTSAPVWEESASFLIRKPHAESLELQVL